MARIIGSTTTTLNPIDRRTCSRSHTAPRSSRRLRNQQDTQKTTDSTTDNVSMAQSPPRRNVQRMIEVRISRKITVLPDRLLEEQLMVPPAPMYQQLVDLHRYRLGSARFRLSRQIRDGECWRVLLNDTEVVGPHGCWVARGTTSWRYPFGSASTMYRVHNINRKNLNQHLGGNLLYTHAAMNVMGFRYALKFTTIVGDVPQQFEVSHLCGHSHCYRPSHLVLDSHRVNLLRSRCRGCGKDKRGVDYNHCVHADLPGSSRRHCFGHEQCPEYCPERLKQRTSAAKQRNG
jgi:hypothetical protein